MNSVLDLTGFAEAHDGGINEVLEQIRKHFSVAGASMVIEADRGWRYNRDGDLTKTVEVSPAPAVEEFAAWKASLEVSLNNALWGVGASVDLQPLLAAGKLLYGVRVSYTAAIFQRVIAVGDQFFRSPTMDTHWPYVMSNGRLAYRAMADVFESSSGQKLYRIQVRGGQERYLWVVQIADDDPGESLLGLVFQTKYAVTFQGHEDVIVPFVEIGDAVLQLAGDLAQGVVDVRVGCAEDPFYQGDGFAYMRLLAEAKLKVAEAVKLESERIAVLSGNLLMWDERPESGLPSLCIYCHGEENHGGAAVAA